MSRHMCLTAFKLRRHILYKLLPRGNGQKLNEKASLYEGHGFSRVPMSLRLTQVMETTARGIFRVSHMDADAEGLHSDGKKALDEGHGY